ncbi:MAG: quinone-interacting membrane-bound oxidoreductase complex subunit QmoC [Deltaproteobacteria bacterium]|nr:quinone-interacting membrane-bound oxidoreductase complex subunit QmoC [Deltaproteobacteria bacterium]
MSTGTIKPDVAFVRDVLAQGGDDLKKCYQCATCAVVCPVSPDDKPFPRKEMIWAQWGAKDKLLSDPDLWLCYQCNDCSVQCPRGARPGDVMGALRKVAIAAYSVPSFLGRMVQNPSWFMVLITVPVLLLGFLLTLGSGAEHVWGWSEFANPSTEKGGYVFHNFVPHLLIYAVFVPTSILAVAAFAMGGLGMWNRMKEAFPGSGAAAEGGLVDVIRDVLAHRHFDTCGDSKWRTWAHFGFLFGFGFLALTTAATIVLMYGFNLPPPLPFSPNHFFDGLLWKIIGNVGAVILIAGCVLTILKRTSDGVDTLKSSFSDWALLLVILVIALTGMGAQLLRLWSSSAGSVGLAQVAYVTYFIHLVFVFYLILYAPYCKLAHLVYRTIALIYGRRIGRLQKEEAA